MNINNFNVVNSNSFNFKKQNNSMTNPKFGTKENTDLSEKQIVDAQTALANYTSNLKFFTEQTPVKKPELKFLPVSMEEIMSDDEFEKSKQELKEKFKTLNFDSIYEDELDNWNLNKLNIGAAHKLLSNENILGEYSFNNGKKHFDVWLPAIHNTFNVINNYKQLEMANYILDDEKLSKNKAVLSNMDYIVAASSNNKRSELIKYFLSNADDERLSHNMNEVPLHLSEAGNTFDYKRMGFRLSCLSSMVYNSTNEEIDKISDFISTYKNEKKEKECVDLLASAINAKSINSLKKIITNPDIYNNKQIMQYAKYIPDFVSHTGNEPEIGETVLSNEKLYTNLNLLNMIVWSMSFGNTIEDGKPKETILRVLNNPEQYSNLLKDKKQNIYALTKMPVSKLENLDTYINNVEEHRQNMLNNSREYSKNSINRFFDNNYSNLVLISAMFDKNTINALINSGFDEAEKHLNLLNNNFISKKGFFDLSVKDIELISKLAKSKDTEGKEFSAEQKIKFIDLVSEYKTNKSDMTKLNEMAEIGIVK